MTNSLGNSRKDGIEVLTNVRDRLNDGGWEEKSVLFESLKLELEIFSPKRLIFIQVGGQTFGLAANLHSVVAPACLLPNAIEREIGGKPGHV